MRHHASLGAVIVIALALIGPVFAWAQAPVRLLFVLSGGRTSADRFSHPEAVAVDEIHQEVYVADTGNDRLLVFGTDGAFHAEIKVWEGLRMPSAVAVGREIYVVGSDPRRVAALDARGRLKTLLDADPGDGRQVRAGSIALSGDRLYVVDRANDRLLAFDLVRRRVLFGFGGHGAADGQFESLVDVAVGPDGEVYGLDMRRASVSVFDAAGVFLRKFGEAGGASGQLGLPAGLGVDRDGNTLVADATRHTLLIYGRDGRFLREYGGMGRSPGWFYFPQKVLADAAGRVFVVEPFLDRVQVFIASLRSSP